MHLDAGKGGRGVAGVFVWPCAVFGVSPFLAADGGAGDFAFVSILSP